MLPQLCLVLQIDALAARLPSVKPVMDTYQQALVLTETPEANVLRELAKTLTATVFGSLSLIPALAHLYTWLNDFLAYRVSKQDAATFTFRALFSQ